MQSVVEKADVAVIGGGTAGVIAALQAARAGASTVLVETSGMLGGTMTVGGIPAPAYFYARERQLIAGLGWELVCAAVAFDGGTLPDFAHPPENRPSYHVRVNPYSYALLAEEACLRDRVNVHLHETVVDAREWAGQWRLRAVGKGMERIITAAEIVDCTGDAVVAAMLGFARVRNPSPQPGTLAFRLGGYEPEALDAEAIEQAYTEALRAGLLKPGDYCDVAGSFVRLLHARGVNQQHVPGADSSSSVSQAAADMQGRESLLRLVRFIRTLPGCEQTRIEYMAPSTAVRETFRIGGESYITYDDYMSGRLFDDAVCHTYYFIDVHHEHGIDREFLAPGIAPTVPLGAMIPRGSRRILAAGRCVSCDERAFSALRVQASCMAMGQAAGAAAALGALQHMPSRQVPLDAIRALLREHGAIVPSPAT